jgi:hypothetical protein
MSFSEGRERIGEWRLVIGLLLVFFRVGPADIDHRPLAASHPDRPARTGSREATAGLGT